MVRLKVMAGEYIRGVPDVKLLLPSPGRGWSLMTMRSIDMSGVG
jgi:hypothetical protein